MFHFANPSLPQTTTRPRRAMPILQALEWALQREHADVDFDDLGQDGTRPGVSSVYVLMQRGALGCQIDGGGKSRPHHDAQVIANALADLPKALGGRAMAAQIAAMLRAGARPDWRPNARPRCAPREWRNTKHGPFAATERVGTAITHHRGRRIEHDVLACPITYIDTPQELADLRRAYAAWWRALDHLRSALTNHPALDRIAITAEMPPARPWAKA